MRRKAGTARGALKRALSKVLGVLDAKARLVYVDRAVLAVKQTFLKLHEAAHAVLPWQRDLYAVIEDCEKTLAPEMSEEFDREANQFASEVLFQLDAFTTLAREKPFGIRVPLNVGKRFGASAYASIRRYVSTNDRACAVLVIDPPELAPGDGLVGALRRVEVSPEFERLFGSLSWPDTFTPSDSIGAMIPMGGKRMSAPRSMPLRDRNGVLHDCIAEAFDSKHQVFVLIHAAATLTKRSVVMPSPQP
jgi:hypothetical protein